GRAAPGRDPPGPLRRARGCRRCGRLPVQRRGKLCHRPGDHRRRRRDQRMSLPFQPHHRTMQLDLDRYVPGLLLWLSNKVSSSASALYHERFGVSVTEWRVLAYFKIHPWSTASKACELMGLDKAAVSRSIANLVGKNILEPRPQG